MKQETTGTSILKPRTRTMAEDVKVAVVREPVKTSGRVESGSGKIVKPKNSSQSAGAQDLAIPKPRGMNNPKVREAVERGQLKHKEFDQKLVEKGWNHRPVIKDHKTGKILKPDGQAPSGHYVELKPNTPSGRAQGEKQAKKYTTASEKLRENKKTKVIYYNPE